MVLSGKKQEEQPPPSSSDTPMPPVNPTEQPKPSIKDFEEHLHAGDDHAPFELSALGSAFATVTKAVDKGKIPPYELRKLLDVLPNREEIQDFDAGFDLSTEITFQLKALQSVREDIFSQDGRIKEGKTTKDAKDFLTSSTNLLQMLQKSKAEVINLDRLQAIEEAVITAVKELPEDARKTFLTAMNTGLERIK